MIYSLLIIKQYMEAVEDYLALAEQQVAKGRMSPHHFNFEELFLEEGEKAIVLPARLIRGIAIYCNSNVAIAFPRTYCNTFSVPPINTILLQYLLQYIAIQHIVP